MKLSEVMGGNDSEAPKKRQMSKTRKEQRLNVDGTFCAQCMLLGMEDAHLHRHIFHSPVPN